MAVSNFILGAQLHPTLSLFHVCTPGVKLQWLLAAAVDPRLPENAETSCTVKIWGGALDLKHPACVSAHEGIRGTNSL